MSFQKTLNQKMIRLKFNRTVCYLDGSVSTEFTENYSRRSFLTRYDATVLASQSRVPLTEKSSKNGWRLKLINIQQEGRDTRGN